MSDPNVTVLLNQILSKLGAIESKIGVSGGSSSGSSGTAQQSTPASVTGFDSYCAAALDPFVAACDKLGGDAKTAGGIVKAAWGEMRNLIVMATACKEPANIPALLTNLGAKVKEASQLIKRNEWEKHTKTVSEGLGCLNWVAVKPAPRDFIESFIGGSDYWANNIRKEFRTTNPDQIAFCDTFKKLLVDLAAYVKEFHTTGLAWNPRGGDVSSYSASAASAAPAAAKPAAAPAAAPVAATAAAPKADLFSSLNKEGGVTSGLKKVTKDMQTWRAEYKGGDAPAPAAAAAKAAPSPKPTAALKGPAKLEYQEAGSRWLVEYQSDANGVVNIAINDKKETVYIFGCVGATIDIKGKCKSIAVDSCKKTTVQFDNAMASIEVVNSQRMQVTVREAVSSVAIDKTDGMIVTLPKSSMHTEIVASKSSEMNVQFPDEHGDLIERPIPEQYVHRVKGTTITADVSDLYSH